MRSWLRRRKKKLAGEKSFELKEMSDDDGREVGEGWVGMSREQVHGWGVGLRVWVWEGVQGSMTSHPRSLVVSHKSECDKSERWMDGWTN